MDCDFNMMSISNISSRMVVVWGRALHLVVVSVVSKLREKQNDANLVWSTYLFFLWRLRAGGFCLNHAHSMASMALCIIQTMAPHRQIMPDHCSACLVFLSWPQSNCASELLEVLRMDVDFQHCLRMGSHTKGVDWTLSAASLGVQHRLLFTFVHRLLRMRGHYCSWSYINCLLFKGMNSCTRDFFDTTYRVSTSSHSFSTQLLHFVWSPLWHISWHTCILTFYLTYINPILHIFWHCIGHMFWRTSWYLISHICRHSIWDFISHTQFALILSDMLSNISSDILFDIYIYIYTRLYTYIYIYSGILFDKSDIYSTILFGILLLVLPVILSDILSDIRFDILSNINYDILFDIYLYIYILYSNILSDISLTYILHFIWHSVLHAFCHSIWCSIWHSI